jgi:hypothetical protein
MIFDQFSQFTHYCHILIMNHHSFTGIEFKTSFWMIFITPPTRSLPLGVEVNGYAQTVPSKEDTDFREKPIKFPVLHIVSQR